MFKPVSFLGKLFKSYLLLPAHPAKIRFENIAGNFFFPSGIRIQDDNGKFLKLDANDWITRTMIEQGCYEPASIDLAKRITKAGGVFLDIGANFGLYTCLLGYKNADLKIYAVEPNFRVLHRLTNNIQLNNLTEQVQIINAAVSDQFQFVYLELPQKNNMGTTVTSLTNNGNLSVLSCPLSMILESNPITEVELLKIDIEGNEFSVLEHFPFNKYLIKNIILEFNFLSKISLTTLKSFFEERGFDVFTITGESIKDEKSNIPENNLWIVNQLTNGRV